MTYVTLLRPICGLASLSEDLCQYRPFVPSLVPFLPRQVVGKRDQVRVCRLKGESEDPRSECREQQKNGINSGRRAAAR